MFLPGDFKFSSCEITSALSAKNLSKLLAFDVYQYNLADVAWNPFGKTAHNVTDYTYLPLFPQNISSYLQMLKFPKPSG